MTAPKYRKYPVAPLLRLFGDMTSRQAEKQFGVHYSTINRWRTDPRIMITEWDADRYAILMGKHPSELWNDWFDLSANIQPRRKLKQGA